jgi:hypothetical protein
VILYSKLLAQHKPFLSVLNTSLCLANNTLYACSCSFGTLIWHGQEILLAFPLVGVWGEEGSQKISVERTLGQLQKSF